MKIETYLMTILLILGGLPNLHAQNLKWVENIKGTSDDRASSISIDSWGNVYTTGYFKGTTDFDPGVGTANLTAAGSKDIFISKLDSSGNFVWARNIGGVFNEQGFSIAVDSWGNVYTTGTFQSTVDFDPGPDTAILVANGFEHAFISKLDSSGNFVWAKKFGGAAGGKALTIDASGNVHITGFFFGTVDFDPGPDTTNLTAWWGSTDIFITKLDSSGSLVWARSMGGPMTEEGNSIAVDSFGNVYTTGSFLLVIDFDPGISTFNLYAGGSSDVFISKLDSSGNFVWARNMGGFGNAGGSSITLDNLGNIYTTGSFGDTVDFDPGMDTVNLTAVGGLDVFVSKFDTSGNFLWAKKMGGGSHDGGHSIAVDAFGDIYTTGYYTYGGDFNPGTDTASLIGAGGIDIFISKLDSAGNFVWAKSIGGINDDWSVSMAVDASRSIHTTGYFEGTVDFDPGAGTVNLTAMAANDVFVHKMTQCLSVGTDVQTACNSYTWIDGNTYTSSTNNATYRLISSAGCDSIVTLNLTINNSSKGTDVKTACNSFTWMDSVTYTASNNTATYLLTNISGCDSVVTLNLTINTIDTSMIVAGVTMTAKHTSGIYQWINCTDSSSLPGATGPSYTAASNGTYAVIITNNGCSDTSRCIRISTVGVEELITNTFQTHPNPVTNTLYVLWDKNQGMETLKLMNSAGKVINVLNIRGLSELNLAVDNLMTGLYFIEITGQRNRAVQRFVKH